MKCDVAWDFLFWSLSVLESGVWPERGPRGEEYRDSRSGRPLIPAGDGHRWSAVLLYLKGDLEWFANDVGVPHWSKEQCCGLCWADRDRRNYKDFTRFFTDPILNYFDIDTNKNMVDYSLQWSWNCLCL